MVSALLAVAPAAGAAPSLQDAGTFDTPMFATAPRADASSLYVVERGGTIRIRRGGTTLPTPFLDISSEIDDDPASEGGLASLAFPTDYSTSGLFYVFMTPNDANPGAAPFAPIQIREYRRSANPDVAIPSSGRVVLTIPHPDANNHYGGALAFGPDGRLYISTGDGGGAGDPGDDAQRLDSRLGKILRIDPRQNGLGPYGVPVDNPFVGKPGDDLIWSYGLRNPFRFSFDRATGALSVGDVGQDQAEEIDFAPAPNAGRGANFGWNRCEANFAYPGPAPCGLAGVTPPALVRPDPAADPTAITGGVVVRDPGLPTLLGRYVYG
ncbi:MAG: hypothetical protein QOD71_735, partial [Thermoleophilaceae bacterium]|nr:hypothetical protein [Thermoleophilaceae bacterium]